MVHSSSEIRQYGNRAQIPRNPNQSVVKQMKEILKTIKFWTFRKQTYRKNTYSTMQRLGKDGI